ncbi:DNA cytosine methyltransferase [Streptomyces sp. AS13]|uniref:DNA cytosine methyltransferase n=1 Tax=Streptomyces sp. AS13 TaxID=3038080 RepID=UPI00278BEFB1|nr:DNA cytosine methyltransferase [Streptomyces sp. AS13]
MEPLRVMDIFAGCGGFAEGFRSYVHNNINNESAFESVAAVDIDRAAHATFAANHLSADAMCLDIETFDPSPFAGGVDIITGGPPCQGFSGLGNGYWDDPRNSLWREYTRVVSTVQPMVFVMENVDRFQKSFEYKGLLDAVKPGGCLADYALVAGVLNAADYGVAQARKRAILIGTRRDLGAPVPLPAPTHARGISQPTQELLLFGQDPIMQPWTPVDAIFDLSARLPIERTDLPARFNSAGVPGPFRTSELHIGRTPTALSLARYRAIPPGGNRKHLSGKWTEIDGREYYLSTESWDRHHTGSADVMGRLWSGRPSVTIRTEFFKPEKGRYLHPVEHRPISHYEAALIQGFPEDYLWHGTKIEIARQIGNAIPVGLARAIAGVIHERLKPTAGDIWRAVSC